MPYYTRVLTKQEDFPLFEEVADLIRAEHPQFRLHLEEGSEEDWESLLLASEDEVEIALIERNPVYDGSIGQDEIADFLEDLRDSKPESGVSWLRDYLAEVKTIYAFQHLQGADTEEGGNVLHALRGVSGSAAMPFSRRIARGLPTRKASTLSGSFPTPSRGRGIWLSCRTIPGKTSKWIWAIPIIEQLF